MSTATTSVILYQLYNLQRRNRYRVSIPVCNTYRISCNSTTKDGYCDRVRRSFRTEVNAGKDPPPELPAPPPRSSSFIAWAYGAIITMFTVIIPLLTSGKWGALIALKRKMDSTLERVEEVTEVVEDVAELVDELTDKATEYLPDDSRLKYILDKIDDAAEQTVKAADFAQEILDKIFQIYGQSARHNNRGPVNFSCIMVFFLKEIICAYLKDI